MLELGSKHGRRVNFCFRQDVLDLPHRPLKSSEEVCELLEETINRVRQGPFDLLIKLMSALQLGKVGSVRVISINIPGKAIFVTEELLRTLEAQEELALTCATNTR